MKFIKAAVLAYNATSISVMVSYVMLLSIFSLVIQNINQSPAGKKNSIDQHQY